MLKTRPNMKDDIHVDVWKEKMKIVNDSIKNRVKRYVCMIDVVYGIAWWENGVVKCK